MSSSSGNVGGVACTDAQLSHLVSLVESGVASDTKLVYLRALATNWLFTTAQAAKLVDVLSSAEDKVAAVTVLRDSLSDPSNTAPIVEVIPMSDGKAKAETILKAAHAHTPCTLAVYQIEDHGHRSAADVQRLLDAIDAQPTTDGKVHAVEAEIKTHPTPPFEPSHLVQILGKFSFSADARKVLDLLVPPAMVYPMTAKQMIEVLKTYPFAADQLAILPALKKFLVDPQNKLDIIASYDFAADKDQAEVILRDVVVRKQPPTPPPAAVQAALKKVGKCPAGYDWRQVQGGWRCAAGGHFVSDAQLQAAL